MKRRTSTAPIRVYSYGCRLPIQGADIVEQQLLLAHRYYNMLIEIEKRRREKSRAAQSESSVVVTALESRIQVLSDAIEKGYATINTKKGQKRTNAVEIKAERIALKALRAQRTSVVAELKAAKAEARTPELKEHFAAIQEEANEEIRQARARCGVYWGTYLLVEQAVNAARKSPTDPEFHRLAAVPNRDGGVVEIGHGRVGVELMRGVAVSAIMSGQDTRLQIDPPTPNRMSRVRLRVGTTPKGNAPIWAEWPFRLHRPLPADGVVKWAWVHKSLKGRWVNWELQVVVESESLRRAPRAPSDGGVIAIDIGWRKRPVENGTDLRVAYWVNDQGEEGEFRLPVEWQERLDHVASLRAIEDRNFNTVRAALTVWRDKHEVPEWLTKALEYLPAWKAPRRLGGVVDLWKTQRFEGDTEIFEILKAWWRQHRHLYDWEACERDRTLNTRRLWYQQLAAKLTRCYAVVVLEDFDISQVAKLQAPDSEKPNLPKATRRNRTVAACSTFVAAIENAAPGNGCTVDHEPCAYTTAMCSVCGHIQQFDHAILHMLCDRCGGESGPIDQDRNAARNLLAAWTDKWQRSQSVVETVKITKESAEALATPAQEDVS